MNSYFRIRLPYKEATTRLQAWFGRSLQQDPIQVGLVGSVDLACDSNGQWRGPSLFVYQTEDWTVFEDFDGFAFIRSTEWLKFAEVDEFIRAGYNDSVPCAELIVIDKGVVLREFLYSPDEPAENVNIGLLPQEKLEPIQTWVDVARIVDEDDLAYSERGWLWIFSVT